MPDIKVFFHAVAFIDLLGMGREFETIPEFPQSEEELRALRAPFDKVDQFRSFVSKGKETLERRSAHLEQWAQSKPAVFHAELQRAFTSKANLEFIGDAAMLSVKLEDDADYSPLKSIHSMLVQVAGFILDGLVNQRPLRGGVSVGRCIEMGATLVGQAVARAYHLESKTAGYPRVVIHPDFEKYLIEVERAASVHPSPVRRTTDPELVRMIRECFGTDTDGQLILDYVAVMRPVPGAADTIASARRFVTTALERFTASNDPLLAPRYRLLDAYFTRQGL